jgi:flavin reductase (DIM6/NTAB) family NADH-FMN oxidoreductase RutF
VTEVTIDQARFRQVLGSYPTGVSVITAADSAGQPLGMIVGTFTSVSLDPPLVGFLPDKKSSTWPQIEAAGKFCVNILGSDQQDLCRRLSAKGPERFADVDWSHSVHGLPILADTIATIECALHAVHEAGDHWFVLGKVLAMDVTRNEDPMLFHRGRYGGFAELA